MNSVLVQWPPVLGKQRFLSRAFASRHSDLDIDFDLPRPALVTELLSSCLYGIDGEAIDAKSLWLWTVSERLQGLLAIANASTGDSTAAVAVCSNADCREQIELQLGLSSFADQEPTNQFGWLSPEGKKISCRLPTGQDQLAWQNHAQAGHGAQDNDESWLAKRLIENTSKQSTPVQLPDTWIDSLGIALSTVDPLTALDIDISCPFCNQPLRVDMDLEQLIIEGLRLQQRRLIEQIHRLAYSYHWSETDIASLPSWRRERYLARVIAERE